tara:strand:- start:291 stop:509 length:219 start_codon:yes stop_codon:yes gene_type:complete
MSKPSLKPCPICQGEAVWCDTHDPKDIHICHFIVCVGKCGTQFDTTADANPESIQELKDIAAYTFNTRKVLK